MSSMGQVDITKALTRQRGTNQGGKLHFTCHTRRILVMRLKEFSLLRLCCAAVLGLKTNQRNLRTSHKLHLNFVLIDIHRGEGEVKEGAKEVVKQRKCKKRESSSSNSFSIGMTPLAAAVVPVATFFALLYCSLFLSLSHSPSLSLPLPVSL